MFAVMLFLLTVGTVAFHQLVKVYQMTVEVRTVYTSKLDLDVYKRQEYTILRQSDLLAIVE